MFFWARIRARSEGSLSKSGSICNKTGVQLANENLSLYVAAYPDEGAASSDFADLKAASDAAEVKVRAAVVATRNADGKVDVKEHQAGAGRRAMGWGAAGGLVVGLFSPPLLLAAGVGAVAGGGLHELVKHYEEKKLAKDLEPYLPPGSSALIAIVDDVWADRVGAVLTRSQKKVAKAIDSGDYDKIVKALTASGLNVEEALAS